MMETMENVGCFFDNHPKCQYTLEDAIAEVAPNSKHKKLHAAVQLPFSLRRSKES